nr:PREDICTED: sodium-dependent lysophosphatidylcholine symporter 1-like [Latimeria chalumnae]|eukprot:XP_006003241.1 PREDICTED: sodium-dependent lysophosphatidylcholine symporter 1-like [Latimeria chalumnae]
MVSRESPGGGDSGFLSPAENQSNAGTSCPNQGQKPYRHSLPFCRKICYAVGGAPYHMTGNAIGFFLQIFLLDVVQMETSFASLILFLGRVWDAFTDPLVGFLVSKSRRTRLGKLMPWIILSMPVGVISYFLLWFTPSDSMSQMSNFFWYLLTYCIFQTCMTCYHVPYSALTMFLGADQRDRDSATAYRMGMEMLGTLAGATIQGQIVGVYHRQTASICSDMNVTLQNSTTLFMEHLHTTRQAYKMAAGVLGGLYLLCCLVLFLGVKEHTGNPLKLQGRRKVPLSVGLKAVVRHVPYLRLTSGFLFSSLAFQLTQGNFALFCTHVAGLGGDFQHLVLVLLVSAALSIPVWQWVLGKLGKKATLLLGLTVR